MRDREKVRGEESRKRERERRGKREKRGEKRDEKRREKKIRDPILAPTIDRACAFPFRFCPAVRDLFLSLLSSLLLFSLSLSLSLSLPLSLCSLSLSLSSSFLSLSLSLSCSLSLSLSLALSLLLSLSAAPATPSLLSCIRRVVIVSLSCNGLCSACGHVALFVRGVQRTHTRATHSSPVSQAFLFCPFPTMMASASSLLSLGLLGPRPLLPPRQTVTPATSHQSQRCPDLGLAPVSAQDWTSAAACCAPGLLIQLPNGLD